MRMLRENGLLYLIFDHMTRHSELVHGIFTRRGGTSDGPYAALNVGCKVGDNDEAVRKNRMAIADALGGGNLVFLSQVHGSAVHVLESGKRSATTSSDPPEADGIITDGPHNLLVIQVADCQPVLLYDPQHRVVANVHSGWRGSVSNVIGAALSKMKERYGTDPGRVLAGIGPSLGPCCAEFINYRTEIPEAFWKYKDAAHRFNFWKASRDQLADAGVRPGNIEGADICTRCNPHLFYSYRKNNNTGRLAAVIGLR